MHHGKPARTKRSKEVATIMRRFIQNRAETEGVPPKEYERRIRKDGTYSDVRNFCSGMLIVVDRVVREATRKAA